jgi:chromosome segregation ATPase
MKKLLVFVLVLAVAIGALGYWRGWFSVTKEGKVDVQADPATFKHDKDSFSKTVGEKAKAMKGQLAGLWKKSKGLTDDDKKNLGELEKKRDRLEHQIEELDNAGQDNFESIKQDLSKSLAEVEQKIDELTKKLEKEKDK